MMMNPICALFICGVSAIPSIAVAQQAPPTPAELKSRLEKELSAAWIKNADWVMDFDAAKAKSKASGKLIFAYFTRSYAP